MHGSGKYIHKDHEIQYRAKINQQMKRTRDKSRIKKSKKGQKQKSGKNGEQKAVHVHVVQVEGAAGKGEQERGVKQCSQVARL